MIKKITVFTPTYNRETLLRKVYESLLKQDYKNFEWVVVDDGSTDNTQSLIEKFIQEDIIKIVYYKQKENGGKHRAINKGVGLATGELFLIVDSDDYLTDNALRILMENWDTVKNKKEFCGISGLKGFSDNQVVGGVSKDYILDCSILDYRYKYEIKGDKAEAFVTDILRKNSFPEFEGENFISESIIWNKIGSIYKMRWINEIIYICEYLDNGLSSRITSLRINNINGTLAVYRSNINYNIPYKFKLKSAINYYRFLFHSNYPSEDHKLCDKKDLNAIGKVGGIILNFIDKKALKRKKTEL